MHSRPFLVLVLAGLAALSLLATGPARTAQDVDARQEKAVKGATRAVAPYVVRIETSGGTEVVQAGPARGPRGGGVRRGVGPTTGVIVSAEGHVISSAFNFANNPSTIRVTLPGAKE